MGETELRLHVVKPAGWSKTDRRPCLVSFFGGGWSSGTPETSIKWAKWAAGLGLVGIAPDYRTRQRFGGTPEDCVSDGRAAVRWVQEHAAELGVDPGKIIAQGGSAGGHVAAWTAIPSPGPGTNDPAPNQLPAALVLLNPVTDTKDSGYGGAKRFGGDAARALACSVPDRMPAKMPPTIVFHATADITVPYANSVAFQEKLVSNSNRCELVTFEGLGHSFNSSKYGEAGKAADKKAHEDVAAFLASLGLIENKTAAAGAFTAGTNEPAPSFSYSASDDTNNPAFVAWQKEFAATHDARMKWWREARFGMFIHWGVYSVPAGVWDGKEVKSAGEWIMNRGRIPAAEYQKLPAQFNPTNFNAEAWVKLAKQAGMKYIVITAKHHDGFAMFRSKADPFNIYDATPFKRDPLKELAAACQREGIKLGFYYSQAQDWNHPGGAAAASKTGQFTIDKQNHWDAAQQGSMDDYLDKVAVPQVKELLTGYGPVAVLWWDTPTGMNAERALKLLPLLRLQPGIISNNRLESKKSFGDFSTPENKIPTNSLAGDWETCMTMNHTWGYRSYDHDWKSTETLVRNLVDIASKGGNFLLNVGPTSEGLIPEPSVERLKEMGAWMRVNGESIYGTSASPLKIQPAWGRITQKENTLFLHVFDWPKDEKIFVAGLNNRISSATLLATGKELKTSSGAESLTVSVPATAPDKVSSTIVLKLENSPKLN